ncbi:MAG: hypothetical protein KGR19_05475 [Acidobacteria bacterium]|nr:hypothetical protein [Acidobacteriota bacterium]
MNSIQNALYMTVELPPLPASFAATRDALHQVAEKVLAPARVAATGDQFSLEATENGFGTPTFPDGGSVRVEGNELVVESISGEPTRLPITSLKRAGAAAGVNTSELDDVDLAIDEQSSAVLELAYHFGDGVLRELREVYGPGQEPTRITLWPEHFDIAFEMGIEADGRRAGYGLSPGDENHEEPYFYVGPWSAPDEPAGWNASGFTGAELGWSELRKAADPHVAALDFLGERFQALQAS